MSDPHEKQTSEKRKVGDGTPGPGRPKGVPNKTTQALKDMVIQALHGAGGVEYLQRQAEENPGPFLTLVGKVLPLTVAGDPDNPLRHEHSASEALLRIVDEIAKRKAPE